MEIKFISDYYNLEDCFLIREKVFIKEQGFSADNELDDIDKIAEHLLVLENDTPVATARLFKKDGKYFAGRICVLKEYRGKNIGTLIMQALENKVKEHGDNYIYLSSQLRVSEFYKKLGYEICSEEYLDEFCPHILMRKAL